MFRMRTFPIVEKCGIVKSKNEEAIAQLRKLVQPFLLRREKKDEGGSILEMSKDELLALLD